MVTVSEEILNGELHLLCSVKIYRLIFTCSKSAIETLEKGVKQVQSQQLKYHNSISIFEFEQTNISWVASIN